MLRLALERQGATGATRKRFASPPARDRREEARRRRRRRIFLEPRRGLVDGGIGAREPRSARCGQSRRKSTVEEEKEGGRRKNRGIEVRRTSASLLPSMKRKDLEDWGLWTDREVCVGTRGTGSKMEGREEEEEEEGRGKLWKRARLGTRGEERRSREEGKFM